MEQRRLRPGDRLDDYCPRERRLSDHVVVAVVDNVVKQTRCVACDTEHPFKEGKVPPRRLKKDAPAALVERVLEELVPEDIGENGHEPAPQPNLVQRPERRVAKNRRAAAAPPPPPVPIVATPPAPPPEPLLDDEPEHAPEDDGPVHRRLIRATLPRPEGQPAARPLPDFTMRQPGARSGGFARGGPANRFGPKAGNKRTAPWADKSAGPRGNRPGVSAHGGETRGRHKASKPHGSRSHPKKTR